MDTSLIRAFEDISKALIDTGKALELMQCQIDDQAKRIKVLEDNELARQCEKQPPLSLPDKKRAG